MTTIISTTLQGQQSEGIDRRLERKASKAMQAKRNNRQSWMAEALAALEEAKFTDDNITWEEVLEDGVS